MIAHRFPMSMARLSGLTALSALCLTLAACGEAPQVQERHSAAKKDAPPTAGTESVAFKQGDWKPGDPNAWTQQLKARAQYGMSDYQRVTN